MPILGSQDRSQGVSPKQIITIMPNGLARFQYIGRRFACMTVTEVLRFCSFVCPILYISIPSLCSALVLSLDCAEGSDIQASYRSVTSSCMSGSSPQLPCSCCYPSKGNAAIPFFVEGEKYFDLLYICQGGRASTKIVIPE